MSSVHPGLTRQLSSSSRHSSHSHSRSPSLMSPSARHSRFSFHEAENSEVLQAKAHPGGVLRGIAARRAFNDIIWPMQAHARQSLARRRFVEMQNALYPQRSQTLEARVVSLATALRAEDDELDALRSRVQDAGAQAEAARRRYEDKAALLAGLERQLEAAAVEDVSPAAVEGLQRRLGDAQRLADARDRQIEDLLAKLADVERQGYAAATSTAAVSRALEDAKGRMERRLHPEPSAQSAGQASGSRWAAVSSPTLHRLDRATRSPRAPAPKPAPSLTLQIPGSEARDAVPPLTPSKRSASMRLRRAPLDPALLSARSASRFSMPPQSAAAPPVKVTIVRERAAEPAPAPKRREDAQRRLEAFYKPVFSPTTPGYGLRALQEEQEPAVEEEEALPAYAAQLLAQLSQSDLTLGNGEGGDFSLRVGNSRIMATLEHAKEKKQTHSRKESRPALFKIFGLR